ncbi:MAG: hypothetical protein Q9196_006402 [Gyalolechia fulgens]
MDLQGSFVPPEVLLSIIKLLPCDDIRNLRKVSPTLNAYSIPYAVRRVYLSTHWRDRENLTRISQHPVLSRFIEEIVYDSTNCEEYLTDLDAYKDLFGQAHYAIKTASPTPRCQSYEAMQSIIESTRNQLLSKSIADHT